MVKRERIYSSFKQSCDSCVLASYAIVSNYYTNIDINDYFKDYCRHYDVEMSKMDILLYLAKTGTYINDNNKYECTYACHFHLEWNKRKIAGLKIIEELHSSSIQRSFVKSRSIFDVEYVDDVMIRLDETRKMLMEEDAFLTLAFRGTCSGRHIAPLGYDEKGLCFMIETRPSQAKTGILIIDNISSVRYPGDGLLCTKKKQP